MAILIAEYLGDELDDFTVQIFATDADADAVAFARRGVYSAAALATVPEVYRGRYFALATTGGLSLNGCVAWLSSGNTISVSAPRFRISTW